MDERTRKSTNRRQHPSAEELMAAALEVHERQPGPISLAEFKRLTGFTETHVSRVFPGRWTELRQRVGIPLHAKELLRYTTYHLLAEFHRVAKELGRIPRRTDFDRISPYSPAAFRRNLGHKAEVLRRYGEWLAAHDPGSPFTSEVQAVLRRKATADMPRRTGPGGDRGAWPGCRSHGVPVFGKELNLGSLAYAPTNENGVICLFGMLAGELGFRIESIGTAFPDCEAKRALDADRSRWERVRIEFEYRSRNFRDHGHDPAGCELIVCWQHDWPECPVEVLELAGIAGGLERRERRRSAV